MPLNTREGVAQAPIAPGERCLWVPWLALEAGEPVTLHDAREPFALADPDHVGALAGLEDVGGDLLSERVAGRVVGAELDEVAWGSVPALSK